eukprot:Skav234958  [mRNA]  locus=scaffold2817:376401:378539:- [translate_table: standard]
MYKHKMNAWEAFWTGMVPELKMIGRDRIDYVEQRMEAFRTLAASHEDAIMRYCGALPCPGGDDSVVREIALRDLYPSNSQAAFHLERFVVSGLHDPCREVRAVAFHFLGDLHAAFLEDFNLTVKLVYGLNDPYLQVRSAACESLGRFAERQVNRLELSCQHFLADVLHEACVALSNCSANVLAQHSSRIVLTLEAGWNFLSTDVPKGDAPLSVHLLFKVPIEESPSRNTWLHVAAACNSTQVCQALLASGLAVQSLRNANFETASDVARLKGYADLAEVLRPGTFQTRGGSGGAIAKALDSKEPILEVSWWVIPLPGWEGMLGTVHSILKVDAGEDQYLIEGVCPETIKPEGVQRPEIEKAAKNGLFISNWAEIKDAGNVQRLTDVKPCFPFGITVAALVHHLLQRGPYDVGSNNCHHTALHGYNFCAAERLQSLPINAHHTTFAWFLSKFSIDLAFSRSCGEPLPSAASVPIYENVPRDENVTLALPRHWTDQVRNGAVDLEKSSDEFLNVEAYLLENGGDRIPGFQIVDIKRNQNLEMLKVFRTELHKMHQQRQLRLFHSAAAHDKVMKQGFKMAYSSLKFNAYGAGLYFAQDLRLADHFASSSHAGVKEVLLCCVAAGKSHVKERIFEFVPGDRWSGKSENEWTSKLIEPDHRQAPDGYDSCIAESREALVVYRESQVFWEYAIQYKSTGSAGNPYGDLRGLLKEVPQN